MLAINIPEPTSPTLRFMLKASGASGAGTDAITWSGFVGNLVPVFVCNLAGGSVLVGRVYFVIYRRSPHRVEEA
jgi:formate/nitrite transporter FocA (FNT family)